jgi:hypothetical protein
LIKTWWTLHADWDPLTSGLVWITTLLLASLAKLVEERLVKEWWWVPVSRSTLQDFSRNLMFVSSGLYPGWFVEEW